MKKKKQVMKKRGGGMAACAAELPARPLPWSADSKDFLSAGVSPPSSSWPPASGRASGRPPLFCIARCLYGCSIITKKKM